MGFEKPVSMRSRWRTALACLAGLVLVLGIMLAGARAAHADDAASDELAVASSGLTTQSIGGHLWVGGTEVTDATTSGPGWSYSGDDSAGTLTLTNANITGASKFSDWILTDDEDEDVNIKVDGLNLTINLVGANTVGSASDDAIAYAGIFVSSGSLTFTGDGSLNVYAARDGIGKATYYDYDTKSTVRSNVDVTIAGGNTTVDGGWHGIHCTNFEMTGGRLKTTGWNQQGVQADCGNIVIKEGTLEVESTNSVPLDCSTYLGDDTLYNMTIEGGSVTATAVEGDFSGVYVGGLLTVKGGSLTAISAVPTSSSRDDHVGILAQSMDVSGGIVNAEGAVGGIRIGNYGSMHYAGRMGRGLTVSGGIVKAKTTKSSYSAAVMVDGDYADGAINLGKNVEIATPAGGKLSSDGTIIVQADGKTAAVDAVVKQQGAVIITFDSAGGSPVSLEVGTAGQPLEKPTDPKREGFRFDGWLLNGQPFDFSKAPATDATLTATWTDLSGIAQAMYRLYNPNSGEHFYTASVSERDDVEAAGWTYEGIGWYAPLDQSIPVYRLYNAYGGEHHYTMSAEERDSLIAIGWTDEDIGWYSEPSQAVPLLREYNPNMFSCNHNYTTSQEEHDGLVALGWRDEGKAWYAVAAG